MVKNEPKISRDEIEDRDMDDLVLLEHKMGKELNPRELFIFKMARDFLELEYIMEQD